MDREAALSARHPRARLPSSIPRCRRCDGQSQSQRRAHSQAARTLERSQVEHPGRPTLVWPYRKVSIHKLDLYSFIADNKLRNSHGRDNALRVWKLPSAAPGAGTLLPSRDTSTLPQPELMYELEVNALNYCPFGLMSLSREDAAKLRQRMGLPVRKGADEEAASMTANEPEALVAVPHTLEAAYVCTHTRKRT